MKIEHGNSEVEFVDIKIGEVIEMNVGDCAKYYMRITSTHTNNGQAVNLETGALRNFNYSDLVKPIPAKVVIG